MKITFDISKKPKDLDDFLSATKTYITEMEGSLYKYGNKEVGEPDEMMGKTFLRYRNMHTENTLAINYRIEMEIEIDDIETMFKQEETK